MIVSPLQLGIFYQWKLWANNAITETGAILFGSFLEAVAHQDSEGVGVENGSQGVLRIQRNSD